MSTTEQLQRGAAGRSLVPYVHDVQYNAPYDSKKNQGQFPSSKSNDKTTEQPEIKFVDLADSDDDEPPVQITETVNIRSLLPGEETQLWISDDVILAVLTLRTAGTNYVVVDSTWFQNDERKKRNEQMERHRKKIESSPEKKLVLAFCWGKHWRLLVIDNKNISCYDPREPEITFQKIPKVLELSEDFNLPMVSMRHVGPKQKDTVNCGIFVVLTVETLCSKRQWDYKDIEEFRPKILEELDKNPNYAWTNLTVDFKQLDVPVDIKSYYFSTGRRRPPHGSQQTSSEQEIVEPITAKKLKTVCESINTVSTPVTDRETRAVSEPDTADEPMTVSDSISSVSTPNTVCEPRADSESDAVDKPRIVSEPIGEDGDQKAEVERSARAEASRPPLKRRNFRKCTVCHNESSTTEVKSKARMLLIAFGRERLDLLKLKAKSWKVCRDDLKSAAETVMKALNVDFNEQKNFGSEAMKNLEGKLKEFTSSLDNFEFPEKDLFVTCRTFCMEHAKGESTYRRRRVEHSPDPEEELDAVSREKKKRVKLGSDRHWRPCTICKERKVTSEIKSNGNIVCFLTYADLTGMVVDAKAEYKRADGSCKRPIVCPQCLEKGAHFVSTFLGMKNNGDFDDKNLKEFMKNVAKITEMNFETRELLKSIKMFCKRYRKTGSTGS